MNSSAQAENGAPKFVAQADHAIQNIAMSGEVIVPAVAGIAVAIIGLIGVVWAARITSKSQPAKPELETHTVPYMPPEVEYRKTETQPQLLAPLAITDISMSEIVDAIESTKPYHRDSVHANYVGLRVRWLAKLEGVSRGRSDTIFVTVKFIDGEALGLCRAVPENTRALVSVDKGALVEVIGTLEEVLSRHEASLCDCVIRPVSEEIEHEKLSEHSDDRHLRQLT